MVTCFTTDILNDLTAVLDRIMKDGSVKDKYLSALKDAVDQLERDDIQFITSKYAVSIKESDEGGVLIDVFSVLGPLLDTIEYGPENILACDGESVEASPEEKIRKYFKENKIVNNLITSELAHVFFYKGKFLSEEEAQEFKRKEEEKIAIKEDC